MKAIVISERGGRDTMRFQDVAEPVPEAGEVLIEVTVAGVNFMDIGARTGSIWKEKQLPFTLGVEGSGRILALGKSVTSFAVGQRVAWLYVPGSYAERIVAQATSLVPIPDTIDDQTAAALMMQGITASHFATEFYAVKAGDIALVHAASGGVGMLLSQIIKLRGGSVIGRVSSAEKAEFARSAGADHIIVDRDGAFANETRRLSGGEGVHVVYDGSGPATFRDSLASLRRHGVFAWYGPVLGGPGPIDIMSLPRSILIGYPTFADHIPNHAALLERSRLLFDWVAEGRLRIHVGGSYRLADAAQAHAAMENRLSVGKLLLVA